MPKFKNLLILLVVLAIPLLLTACNKKETVTHYKGIFQTLDNGETWIGHSEIANTQARKLTFHNLDVNDLVADPSDPNTLYAATSSGLFYSYNYGYAWSQSVGMNNQKVNFVAVDPKDSCTIYVSSGRTLYKSVDCGRHFKDIYKDNSSKVEVGPILIDSFNPNIIYIGTSAGDVLKTSDGKTWEIKKRFKKPVMRLIHTKDTRIIVAAVYGVGAVFSYDGGDTWQEDDLKAERKFNASSYVYDLAYDKESNTLIVASKHGLLRTKDNGKTWESLKLLTPPANVTVWSVEIANAGKTIYYATASNLFYSNDGGQTWLTKALPTVNRVSQILLKYMKAKDIKDPKVKKDVKNPQAIVPSVLVAFKDLKKK